MENVQVTHSDLIEIGHLFQNLMREGYIPESILILSTGIGILLILMHWTFVGSRKGMGVYGVSAFGRIVMTLMGICVLVSIASVTTPIIGRENMLIFAPGAGFTISYTNSLIGGWILIGVVKYVLFTKSWIKCKLGIGH